MSIEDDKVDNGYEVNYDEVNWNCNGDDLGSYNVDEDGLDIGGQEMDDKNVEDEVQEENEDEEIDDRNGDEENEIYHVQAELHAIKDSGEGKT